MGQVKAVRVVSTFISQGGACLLVKGERHAPKLHQPRMKLRPELEELTSPSLHSDHTALRDFAPFAVVDCPF
jgi:hypothetical protein